jgi:hypothetical protein
MNLNHLNQNIKISLLLFVITMFINSKTTIIIHDIDFDINHD